MADNNSPTSSSTKGAVSTFLDEVKNNDARGGTSKNRFPIPPTAWRPTPPPYPIVPKQTEGVVSTFLDEVKKNDARNAYNESLIEPHEGSTTKAEKLLNDAYLTNKNFRSLGLDIQTSGNTWVFFTRPYMNLDMNESNKLADHNGFVCDLHSYPNDKQLFLVKNLNALLATEGGAFIPTLTNLFKKGTVIEDETTEVYKIGETFEDHSMTVSHGSGLRTYGGDISCTFQEIRGMPVMALFKTMIKYIYGARRGKIYRSNESRNGNYVDYFMTMYTIVTDVDNETILYWSQYTGITPKSLPYTGIGAEQITNFEPTITFSYSVRTAMALKSLSEFALLCTDNIESQTEGKAGYVPEKIASIMKGTTGFIKDPNELKTDTFMGGDYNNFSSTPYIERDEHGFKLKFKTIAV
jgi:hypothetical protein